MTTDQFLAMFAFAVAMSATPGPNTLMLLASGVNFGFRRTIPHMLGIPFGLGAMLCAVGAGLGALILAAPRVALALKIASIVYMLWLAWGIATSGPVGDGTARGRPMSLVEGALFQWINPKAWAMALTGVSAYTVPADYSTSLAILIATLVLISLPITAAWTGLGVSLRAVLRRPLAVRVFNVTMAGLLLASLRPIVAELRP